MFATRITALSFNRFKMFPVDLMHEVELGVWKAVFTHLIRLLNELAVDKVHELNKRCAPWFCYNSLYLRHLPVFVKYQHSEGIPFDASRMMCLR
jgi:hypothetical protein